VKRARYYLTGGVQVGIVVLAGSLYYETVLVLELVHHQHVAGDWNTSPLRGFLAAQVVVLSVIGFTVVGLVEALKGKRVKYAEACLIDVDRRLIETWRQSEDEPVPLGTEEVWGASICPRCFGVRGLLTIASARYEQRCRCMERVGTAERWPGYDFNTYIELCRCCAIEPLKSGSRWSPFFCDECKERVINLNRQERRWVIPIGRHSMMHGELLSGDEATIDEHAEEFASRVQGLFASGDHLDQWRRNRVRQNLATLDWAPGLEVPLAWYLSDARNRPISKATAFRGLCLVMTTRSLATS